KPKKVKKSKKVKKERKAKKAKRKLIDIGRMLKEDGVGATLAYFRQLASLVKKSGGRMLSAVRVGRLEMQLVIASEDAAKTAITYGKYCGAFYSALAVVKQVIPIKRRRVSMIPDFFNEKGSATLYLRGHVIPLRLLFEALRFLIAFLLFNTKKQKETVKDGQ
ncbi:MAG: DUF2953 domain-containing protein, partial [Oscillospiraceae bacterium]|nr:DUF2953 domain-containing protein [Oscillospiraceae bacterium]